MNLKDISQKSKCKLTNGAIFVLGSPIFILLQKILYCKMTTTNDVIVNFAVSRRMIIGNHVWYYECKISALFRPLI